MKAVEKLESEMSQTLVVQDIAGLQVLQDVRIERLQLKTMDVSVFLRSPPAARRREFESQIIESGDPRLTPKMDFCALCLANEKGEFLFPSIRDKEAIEKGLGSIDSGVIEEIFQAVLRITRIDDQVIENRQKK